MNIHGPFVNIADCRVIIPVLDEIEIISSNEFKAFINSIPFKVSFVDSKSIDNTFDTLINTGMDVRSYDGPKSIYNAVCSVARSISEEFIIVLPVDCKVDFYELVNLDREIQWGGFYKRYDYDSVLTKIYLFLQNFIRSKMFKNLVWTNVFFIKTDLFLKLNVGEGFLEDVILSDKLKEISNPIMLKGPVVVSFRKYNKKMLSRLYINLKVMIYFRLKLKTIKELKHIYSR